MYLLSCNLSEILIVATAFFFNMAVPLLPLQILFLNMVTDVFPAFALGVNKESAKVMEQPPRSKNTPIISKAMWVSIGIYALGITIASLSALLFATFHLKANTVIANNFAFYTLTLAQLWNIFNLPEADRSFFFNEITRNIYVWLAILGSILIVVFAYCSPVMREVLGLEVFHMRYLGYVFLFSLIPIVLIQFLKRLKLIR
jgi:Ca2+-transporting ATPase